MASLNQKEQSSDIYFSKSSPKTEASFQTYQDQDQQFDNQVTIVFNTNPQTILQQFENLSLKLNYQLLEMENTYATAIKKSKNSLFNLFSCVSFCSLTSISGIKISLKQSKYDSETVICKIKQIMGNQDKQFSFFVRQFISATRKFQEANPIIYNQKQIESEVSPSNPFENQNCTFFTVSKILSNPSSQIQKYMVEKLKMIKEECLCNDKDAQKTIKSILRQLTIMIKQIITKLHHKFKDNPQQYNTVMPFCRIAVQNVVFTKVEELLNKLYLLKNQDVQQKFQQRKIEVLSKLTLDQLLQGICASDKLKKYLKDGNCTIADLKTSVNLELACFQFKQITSFVNPRQKVKICENAYASLKSFIYEKSRRNYELVCMEDIIPMTILLLLFSEQRSNLRSQIDVMLNYAEFDANELQLQKRLLLNLSQSYNYISKYWQL